MVYIPGCTRVVYTRVYLSVPTRGVLFSTHQGVPPAIPTRVYLLLYLPGCTSHGVYLPGCTSHGVYLPGCCSCWAIPQGVAPAGLYLRVSPTGVYLRVSLTGCTSGCGLCWFYTSGCGFMLVLSLFYTSQGGYFSPFYTSQGGYFSPF